MKELDSQYEFIEKKDLIGDHTHVEGGIHFYTAPPANLRERRNRAAMLQLVHNTWIKGLLEQSLHGAALIELGLEYRPDAVDHPWDTVVQMPERPDRQLPPGTRIVEVFDESGGSLLILGEPGSGKTTMLLELARDLIARAEQDETLHIPVVFHLSSWKSINQNLAKRFFKQTSLIGLIVAELRSRYNIPESVAEAWVKEQQLALLLDGLDEVGTNMREDCMAAINAFHREYLMPLVICSRTAEYISLKSKLCLQSALCIQPVTRSQVELYLSLPEYKMVRAAIKNDTDLQDVIKYPMQLSLLALAYSSPEAPLPTWLQNLRLLPSGILDGVDTLQSFFRIYRDYLVGHKRPLGEVKLILVGEGSVGKTSLAQRLLYDVYNPLEPKTEGIAICRWAFKLPSAFGDSPHEIHVNVWDFGGQEILHATHQFFLTKRTLYVLVLDNRYSEVENRLDYWLALIRSYGGDSPVFVVGNKSDQHALDLDRRGLLAKYLTIQAIIETSCATGAGIPELRAAIANQIAAMPHVRDPIVTTWFEVKAALEALDADYIPYGDYLRLCKEKGVGDPDSQRALLGFLHDLGIVLHFPDPRLETTNILNPEWVTQGVYRILNTRLPFAEPGVLTWEMLARILDDESYLEKRLFIVDMMQKFELCYAILDRPHTYLIPDLLSKEMRDTGAWDDALRFEVHYSVLPGSVITRLIVQMHRHIEEQTVWRTGVLLACDGNEALVIADLAANHIAIAVRGPGSGRRELLTRIREHLEAIHASYPGLEAVEKIPVPGYPKVSPVDYKWLRDMERARIKEFTPPGLVKYIAIQQLLDGVESPLARQWDPKYEIHIHGGQVGVIGDDADVDGGIHS